MAKKDNKFDISKMGDTVIRGSDSDEQPDLPPADSKDSAPSHAKETIETGHGTTSSHRHMKDSSFDVSKMGDTVIRDRDHDSIHDMAPRDVETQEPASQEAHPFKFQEPPPIKPTHSFSWQSHAQAFDVSKMGDTVIRGRDSDAKETGKDTSEEEHPDN